ncbi:MAG: hypothetical protein AB1512_23315 [Thermodesulfobacteriota bacterium]
MLRPVLLEIVMPTFGGTELACRGCDLVLRTAGLKGRNRKASLEEYPEDWRQTIEKLSTWIKELARLYRHRIFIRIIDAQSPLGLWKQVRHRVFKCPAFIVNRKRTYTGWDNQALEALIDEQLKGNVS